MPEQTMTMLNGLDLEKMYQTVEKLKAEPSLAACEFRANNNWISGGQNQSAIGDFYAAGADQKRDTPFLMQADEPPLLLGKDSAPNPVEHLLHALASCMTTSMIFHASANGARIESLRSRLAGSIDLQGFLGLSDSVRKGYQNIEVTFEVKTDATTDELARWCSFSPVYDVISRSVPVTVRIERIDA